MALEIQKDLGENQVILLVIPKLNYSAVLLEVIRELEKKYGKVGYITLNKPYTSVIDGLVKNKIDQKKFFFIDTLTSGIKKPEPADNCIFVSAPNALTELSIAFSRAMIDVGCEAAVFDSLSTMLVYEGAHSIIQFAHQLITKTRVAGKNIVFISLKEDTGSELIKDLYMFVDKAIEV